MRKLHETGIGFTITSSRPTLGMRFLIEPLGITLPIGAFNGSCIVDSTLKPVEQHLIPESATRRALELLEKFGAEIWLFDSDQLARPRPQRRIRPARETRHPRRSDHR